MKRICVRVVHVAPMTCSTLSVCARVSLPVNITPETRGVWWPGNFLKAPLPEPVPNGSKRSRNNQDYKSKRDEFEVEDKRHVESRIQNQNNDGSCNKDRTYAACATAAEYHDRVVSCPHSCCVSIASTYCSHSGLIYLLIVPLCPVALPSCI